MGTMESLPISTIFYTILGILPIFYLYCKYKLSYWERKGIKQLPDPNFLFGNFKKAILFRSPPGWYLGQLYKHTTEPFIGFYILHKPALLLRDPKLIKKILVEDFSNFQDRNFGSRTEKDSTGMRNLFGIRNPGWKYLRSKISPTMTRAKLKNIFSLMMETGDPMMKYIQDKETNEKGVRMLDAQMLNYKYTTDLIANVSLGTKMNSFENPDSEFSRGLQSFYHGFKRMVALFTVFFIPEMVDVFGTIFHFNHKFIAKVFWEAFNRREKSGETRGDFIDSLIQLKNGQQNPLYKFEGENLLFQSGTFFSGFESSATVASFTLLELARNKEYQELARADILKAVKKHGWTFEAFSEMKFLDQCVAETSRLHPPISTVDRVAKNDYTIPGTDITIEAGTAIYVSLYGLHNDPDHFRDPTVFDPNRYSGVELPDAYLAFGAGPRMCVGVKLGQLHAKIVPAMILAKYEVYQASGVANKLDSRSSITAVFNGIQMEFRKLKEVEDEGIVAQ